jgi:hypothetical protein
MELRMGNSMSLRETLIACATASLWFSWIAFLIACVPTLVVSATAAKSHRLPYLIAGLAGGIAGEFCGTSALFLSLWYGCLGQGQSCNTAQGDMGLIVTIPVGSLLGCLVAMGWTSATLRFPPTSPWASVSCYTGPSRVGNWACTIATPAVFSILTTVVLARLMA